MASRFDFPNIVQSYRLLKGNTRISVLFEPLWGIPFALYNFYLSLYMKERGISDPQIGYLIGIGFISSIIFSSLAGMITDALGRKKTTLIFDLIAWPGALILYMIASSFWLFALATVINSVVRIVAVSWNLMVVEDAGPTEQVAAYNLLNAINISVGALTPLAGLLVARLGIVLAEQWMLGFAVFSMTVMMVGRNHYYRETRVGQELLNEAPVRRLRFTLIKDFTASIRFLHQKPIVKKASILTVLFNTYLPVGAFSSLYFAPFLTGVLKLDKSAIAILGGAHSTIIFLVLIFLLPALMGRNRFFAMSVGIIIQIISLLLLITIPPGKFGLAVLMVVIYAVGFGIAKPFFDSLLAEVTTGKERAGIYAFNNTVISALSALVGFFSGGLFEMRPALIYLLSIGILLGCLMVLRSIQGKPFGFRKRSCNPNEVKI
ncbi:MAG: MFS transporter [Firmicutes bacterium]|nr:MFS transporter [Bacillota bacterium]